MGEYAEEAVEVGMYKAEKQIDQGLSQVVLIGDAGGNT